MITFKQPTLEDRPQIEPYLKKVIDRSCRFSFANMLLWSEAYQMKFAIIEDSLVVSSERKEFTFPIGADDPEPALRWIFHYCEEEGIPVRLIVSESDWAYLEEHYPGEFTVEYSRDDADYIYETKKLIELTGKKYHGKRNHINKFKSIFGDDWSYEPITAENKGECFAMLDQWAEQNEADSNRNKATEVGVARQFLELLETLNLQGGLLRAKGRVVAFTIGEPLRKDTYVVHIEKAFAEVDGAYPMINQQFLAHVAGDYQYVNREEDTGSEGLRKAKMSYRPVMFAQTGTARRIQEEHK